MHATLNVVPGPGPARAGLFPDRPGYFVSGTGTPVVMLHSSLASKSQWSSLAERLATRFRAIALDLCGYGDSAMPAAGASFTLDDEVRLVNARLDRLLAPDRRFHVVGHSYGGLVALRLAHYWGDRIESVSLYEPVAFRMLDDDEPALAEAGRCSERVFRLLEAGRRHDAAQAFVDFWSGPGSYASLPLPVQAGMVRRIEKVPLDFQAAWRWPLRPDDLRSVVAPTLLLAGNRSPAVVQRIVARMTRVLPNCRVGWFDCGHMGPATDAHRINPWIEAFVDVCTERRETLVGMRAGIPHETLETIASGRTEPSTQYPLSSTTRGHHEHCEVL
jgi:pimeloyl-ACP methyl ester carboxylesterase